MIPSALRSRYLVIYAILWAAIAAVHFIVINRVYRFDWDIALSDSLCFNLVFSLAGIGLWYALPWLDLRKRYWYELITQHVTTAALVLVMWWVLCSFMLRSFFPDSDAYLRFLEDSMPYRILNGVFYYLLLGSVWYLIRTQSELELKIQKESMLLSQLKEAELDALRSQIRPHFLFNSLNSLSALSLSKPEQAHEMIIKLSEFMRYSLNFKGEAMSTLEKEIHHVGLYLDIEKIRFGDKLDIQVEVAESCKQVLVPAMILQPLIENAVKFGVYESTEPSSVVLTANMVQDEFLSIRIANRSDVQNNVRKGTGTGLKNVRMRLRTVYGHEGLLNTDIADGQFIVTLNIPCHA